MVKVFISYKSEERPQIAELETILTHLGFDVWFDKNLIGGQSWWDQILQQIRDADVVVLAVSERSLRSLACERERDYAFALEKHIIPIVINEGLNFNRLPPRMAVLQMIHFTDSQNITAILKLARAFLDVPQGKPLPNPLPTPPAIPMVDVSRLMDMMTVKDDLSLEEQEMLFNQLTRIIEDTLDKKEQKDALSGLLTLRNHPQLWDRIADRIDSLLISLPPDLREGVIINHANVRVDNERRMITVMLARIASFTTFSDRLTPEDLFSVCNRFTNLLDGTIRAFGGVVDSFAGNRVMGLFNTQLNPQEDHVTRAVNAALQMQYGLQGLHMALPQDLHFDFAISIHTGIVTLGNVRTANRDKLTVIGNTINIIQDVQNSAAAGDILVTQPVYEQIRDEYDCEPYDAVAIKGLAERPYRVIKRKKRESNTSLDEDLLALLDEIDDQEN